MEEFPRNLREFDAQFATEQACRAYLIRRYSDGRQTCRSCGGSGNGCYIALRACWECGHCDAQTGLRVGTVMESSSLPLVAWFAAIRAVLLRPRITSPELAGILHISRTQTVSQMVKKIKLAIKSEDTSAQLAGLDQVYLDPT